MEVHMVHPFDATSEIEFFAIQEKLKQKIDLTNRFSEKNIQYIAGVDISYYTKNEIQYGICCIVVIHYRTHKVVKKIHTIGEVHVPYMPGYLAFRELPLFIDTVKKLSYEPDIFIFDGNGYLHNNHMGIATHASFFIQKPTIGLAKSYFKIKETWYSMPENKWGRFTDIVIDGDVYGRALITKKGTKPVFLSCGNWIDLDTATKIILNLVGAESRIPIPTRLADIESHSLRKVVSSL